MKANRLLRLGVSALMWLGASAAVARAQCQALRDGQRLKLIEYVEKKFKVPAGSRLEIAESSSVGESCYRKLLFESAEAGKGVPYRLEIFASPDLRFLSKELFDTTVDPVVEERQRTEALMSGLLAPGAPALGPSAAPVTIAVFSDFQCPYCARLAETLKEALPDEAGPVRLVFHYFPLAMHNWARPAAEAAACAQQQGDAYFWRVHDFLFDSQKEINRDNLLEKLAERSADLEGFDRVKFERCVMTRGAAAKVEQDLAFGRENGIHATPTVFVNGKETRVVAPEQLRTLIGQLSKSPRGNPSAAGEPPVKLQQH